MKLLVESHSIREQQFIRLYQPLEDVLRRNYFPFNSLFITEIILIIFNILYRSFFFYHIVIFLIAFLLFRLKQPFEEQFTINLGKRTLTTADGNTFHVKKTDELHLSIAHEIGFDKLAAYAGADDADVIQLNLQLLLSSANHTEVIIELNSDEDYLIFAPLIRTGKLVATTLDIDFQVILAEVIEEMEYVSKKAKIEPYHVDEINKLGRSFETGKVKFVDNNLEIIRHDIGMKLFFGIFNLVLFVMGMGFYFGLGWIIWQLRGDQSLELQFFVPVVLVSIGLIGNPLLIVPIGEYRGMMHNKVFRFSVNTITILRRTRRKEVIRQQIHYSDLQKILLIKQWYRWHRIAFIGSDDIMMLHITVYKEEEGKQLLTTITNILSN